MNSEAAVLKTRPYYDFFCLDPSSRVVVAQSGVWERWSGGDKSPLMIRVAVPGGVCSGESVESHGNNAGKGGGVSFRGPNRTERFPARNHLPGLTYDHRVIIRRCGNYNLIRRKGLFGKHAMILILQKQLKMGRT